MKPAEEQELKVLALGYRDISGGAARAAFRICEAVRKRGVDVQLVAERKTSDATFAHGPRGAWGKLSSLVKTQMDRAPLRLFYPKSTGVWGTNWKNWGGLRRWTRNHRPDLLHLHWISNGMIGVKELGRVEIPVVWTLHDMWALTGGCHYSEGCARYQQQCGECPRLGSKASLDMSAWTLKRKLRYWRGIERLVPVAPSSWLARCAEESAVFSDRKCHVVPYPIDTDAYHPLDQDQARAILRLPTDKKLLLFTAMGATGNSRKGYQYVAPMLETLQKSFSTEELELVVVGSSRPPQGWKTDFRTHFVGSLSDSVSLNLYYSACDVSLAPSVEENLALTVMESLSCGTPVVAFRIGGMPDMIESGHNGYLAEPFEPEDLARGVSLVCRHPEWRVHAREVALDLFCPDRVAEQYLKIYREET